MLLCLRIATVILSLAQCQGSEPTLACEDGWKLYEAGRTCMKASEYCKKPWDEARADCVSQGSDLVKITDKGMRDFVNENLHNRRRYWIGLHDEDANGKFEWLDEDQQTSFESWICYAPRNLGGDERCVEAIGRKNGLWRNSECSTYRYFICQKDAEEIPHGRKAMCDFEDERNPMCVDKISNGIERHKAGSLIMREDASASSGHYISIQNKTDFKFQIKDVKFTSNGCLLFWAYYDIMFQTVDLGFIVDCGGFDDTTRDGIATNLNDIRPRSWDKIYMALTNVST